MAHIFLALGSNVGDKKNHIETAIQLLAEHVSHIQRAPLYNSQPMYYADQDDFVNTVIAGNTDLTAEALLACTKEVEAQVGRIERFRNGPREIDVDILFYDDLILDTPSLTIPHQRMEERDFVLKPLADIAPDFIHPLKQKTVQALLNNLCKSSKNRL